MLHLRYSSSCPLAGVSCPGDGGSSCGAGGYCCDGGRCGECGGSVVVATPAICVVVAVVDLSGSWLPRDPFVGFAVVGVPVQ